MKMELRMERVQWRIDDVGDLRPQMQAIIAALFRLPNCFLAALRYGMMPTKQINSFGFATLYTAC